MSTDAKGPRSTPPRSHDDPESGGPEGQAVTSAEVQDSTSGGDKASSPLEEARAEITRVREQLLRTAADFDNFRKRTRRELEDATRRGSEDLLRELLPVFDNLERAVQHAGTATDAKAVADGVGMVLKQFTDSLGRAGVRRVETIGKSFDPAQHEAIQQVETADQPPGTIVAEVQPGYAMGERLIRAALVVVAKPPQAGNGAPPPSSVSAS